MILDLFAELTPVRLACRAPALTVGGAVGRGAAPSRRGDSPRPLAQLAARGWVETRLTEGASCAPIADALDALRAAGLPVTLLYVFDQVWELGCAIRERVCRITGAHYELVEDFWAFRVAPGESGWAPHRGVYPRLDRDRPEYVNTWVALTDADERRS